MYNDKWTREKHIEYRKLRKEGKTREELKEHFGEDIYFSPYFNKNSNELPWLFFNEIKINPINIPYSYWNRTSLFYNNKTDYFAEFESDNMDYILCLMYYEINNISTYNIVFTTKNQYNFYDFKLKEFIKKKGFISDEDRKELKSIFEKETILIDIYVILKRISFIIFDMWNKNIKGSILSLINTDNPKKIKLYRNIIEKSFTNIKENKIIDTFGNYYFIYEIF
jgi:hypothetical protein